ncbi:hypothetical protein [Staphylococcus pseudintermedius]|uniref:hypothetical protein n=1 Tax=Staphylococcus pseudintermedius TaxID=283734 RepID=UPI001FFC5AA8|nr:hypothetical protein [Staphylococcus pseudintermedius]
MASRKTVEIDGRDAASYGDLAVSYNAQHQVEHIYVTPSSHNYNLSMFIKRLT